MGRSLMRNLKTSSNKVKTFCYINTLQIIRTKRLCTFQLLNFEHFQKTLELKRCGKKSSELNAIPNYTINVEIQS